jgi:acid phosphatase (class A)
MQKTFARLMILAVIFSFTSCATAPHSGWRKDVPNYEQVKEGCRLSAPPARESKEEQEDFNILLDWQKKRSAAELARVESEAKVSFESLFGKPYGPITEQEIELIRPFFERVRWTAERASYNEKQRWGRLRPFAVDKRMQPSLEVSPKSLSYPSGHSTVAATCARALADLFPQRAKELLARADVIALDRVIAGVHFPSDVKAGKDCGAQVYEKIKADGEYQADLAKMRDTMK